MRKPLIVLLAIFFCPLFLLASEYDKAWEALHNNDRKQAFEHLQKAMDDPATAVDAYITYIYLKTFDGDEKAANRFSEEVVAKVKDANPYIYALWFNGSVLGAYGKKTDKRKLELMEKILNEARFNGSLKSAAHYVKGMHLFFSNEFSKSVEEYAKMGSVTEWQLTGPFENLSGSGFYKSNGPLEHPEGSATFKSLNNANIQWFTPSFTNRDGWMFLNPHIPYSTAVVYAQSFVNAPQDMDVLLNAGVSGSIKVWVNDALVLSESHERVTELDCYKNYCKLKKGYNRVLVQVGYSGSSSANFIVRFTDNSLNAIPGLTSIASPQAYVKQTGNMPGESLTHFAEAYFEQRIKESPGNFINYILLSQVYLRNQKAYEARKVIETALQKDPDNSLLRFELLQCLIKDDNRTLISQEVERFKEKDPECFLTYKLNLDKLANEEKYEEALSLLDKMAAIYGEDEDVLEQRINLLGSQGKVEDAIKNIQKAYSKYPENRSFVIMMYNLKSKANKDISGALEVYEDFLKNNYDYNISKSLAQEYIDQGKKDKGIKIFNRMVELFPYDAELIAGIVNFYFKQQDYKKALEYSNRTLALAPYVSTYWENTGVIQQQLDNKPEAISAFKKALYYDAKRYDTRKKLRDIENKKDLYQSFPETDLYDLIRKSSSKTVSKDYGYYYLLDEKFVIVHGEGASEEYVTMVIGINTEKGIDTWKESYIPYNEYTQNLLIEKAEVVKKNGNKLTAEKNGNEMVFTSLEAGDAVIIKYRLQDYSRGRLAREYWDQFYFNAFVPSDMNRYCLLVDKSVPVSFKMLNSDLKPIESDVEDYKLYKWELGNVPAVKDEAYMPPLTDAGAVLHVSTIKSWNDVANWYSDISHTQIENEYELKEAYNEIFSGKQSLPDLEKARLIYNYLEQNIRYSSVSFRQGAYVPQKAAVTLNTRLGDCKDLSSLFVSLAEMAGLDSRLVLVDTRDNGKHEMLLPSVEFNHCIALLKANGKEYYIELTDNNLPFGSLPNTVVGAMSLIIPKKDASLSSELMPIPLVTRMPEKIKRIVDISTQDADMIMRNRVRKTGSLSSGMRSSYKSLSPEKQKEEMEKSVSGSYKNPIKLQAVSFKGLDQLVDSVEYDYECVIKNELIEVGDLRMFRIPYGDAIATIDNFSAETRKFPLEYWRYEDVEEYETVVNIKIPSGKKIAEVPADQTFTFNKSTYSLKFVKNGPDKLTVIRKAKMNRENVLPSQYAEMKNFLNNIIKAESKYIAFK